MRRPKVMLTPLMVVAAALVMGTTTACISSRCDPEQVYDRGLCFSLNPMPIDAGEGLDAVDADAGMFAHYGDPCTGIGECAAPTDYCAIQPGQSSGFCTHTGCLDDMSVCPADWDCLDLSVVNPDLPSICTPPPD